MSEGQAQEGGDKLLTIAEIVRTFQVSRQTLHTARLSGKFPPPEPAPGSTRLRWRESAVAAFFAEHPKRQGERTDLKRKEGPRASGESDD